MNDPNEATQWALVTMQTVNWGGFNGHKRLAFAPPGEATVVSGKTGSGKSTLMDANTVLMHPGKRLNRASNDATGAGRSLVSYMRGYLDKTLTASGGERRLMLRGEDNPTWSAIAQTWRSSQGEYLTVFTAYYLRPNDPKPLRRFAHCPGEFDLKQLAEYVSGQHASNPLRPQAIRADHPDVEFVSSNEALRQWLFDQIGVAHSGRRLSDILYRIQTSGPIGSVHQLFESLVLDKPEALIELLNRSREQWTETQSTYREVSDRERKAAILEPLPELWAKYQENQDSGAFFDSLAPTDIPDDTPFWFWVRTRETALLDAREEHLAAHWRSAVSVAKTNHDLYEQADRAAEDAAQAFLEAGGNALQKVTDDIRIAKERINTIREDRRYLSEELAGAFALPTTSPGVEQQLLTSNVFISSFYDTQAQAESLRDEAAGRQYAAFEREKDLKTEIAYYQGRTDAVSPRADEIRQWYSRESGIPLAELRFVGELIDIEPDFETWRTAAELALGSFSNLLLVPAAHAARFREAVDSLPTAIRISSQVVPDAPQPLAALDSSRLSGRFIFREHRYSGWLSQRLAERFDHVCVDNAAALNRLVSGERGLTKSGQVRDGTRGAHGGQKAKSRPRIGFSAIAIIGSLQEQLIAQTEVVAELGREIAAIRSRISKLENEAKAHRAFARAASNWARYDETGALVELDTLEKRAEALRSDDTLAQLELERDRLVGGRRKAESRLNRANEAAAELDSQRQATMQRKDSAFQHLYRMQSNDVEELDLERVDALALDQPGVEELDVESFNPREVRALVEHLNFRRGLATREVRNYRDRLTAVLDKYLGLWPTLGLGVDPDLHYEQFAEIREHNTLLGLPEAKEKFAANVMRFTAMAASSVQDSYKEAKQEIIDRLDRINGLLNEQEFGPVEGHRLHIEPARESMPEETREFLAALAGLGAYTSKGVGYEEMVERYERFESFMDLVATDADVERLFDVRRHVYLYALETRAEFEEPITHDTFGEKSGGEYQELCAFVLAAAVRYHVGSQGEDIPRFAPVFLDEGLIKADPDVTRRAVNVWKDLGFQPIIAVPLDKHESVMVASSFAWTVSKDQQGRARLDLAQKKAAT